MEASSSHVAPQSQLKKNEDVYSSCLRKGGTPQVEEVMWENGLNKQIKI